MKSLHPFEIVVLGIGVYLVFVATCFDVSDPRALFLVLTVSGVAGVLGTICYLIYKFSNKE